MIGTLILIYLYHNRLDNLKEDLLQVEFSGDYLLDIGWYPSSSEDGCFQLRLIKENDWLDPIYQAEATDVAVLIDQIEYVLASLLV